jgi:hypothetical protein
MIFVCACFCGRLTYRLTGFWRCSAVPAVCHHSLREHAQEEHISARTTQQKECKWEQQKLREPCDPIERPSLSNRGTPFPPVAGFRTLPGSKANAYINKVIADQLYDELTFHRRTMKCTNQACFRLLGSRQQIRKADPILRKNKICYHFDALFVWFDHFVGGVFIGDVLFALHIEDTNQSTKKAAVIM